MRYVDKEDIEPLHIYSKSSKKTTLNFFKGLLSQQVQLGSTLFLLKNVLHTDSKQHAFNSAHCQALHILNDIV